MENEKLERLNKIHRAIWLGATAVSVVVSLFNPSHLVTAGFCFVIAMVR